MKMKIGAALIGLCLLLGGCAEKIAEDGSDGDAFAEVTSADGSDEDAFAEVTSADGSDGDAFAEDDFDGDTFVEVTPAELDELSAFVRRADAYGFLLSAYSSPEEVSLGEVFYMGAGLSEEPTSEEAAAYLRASGREEVYTTCVKLDADQVYDLLRRRLGCDPGELDLSAVGVFLPEYNAFFGEEADVNYVRYECVSAIRSQGGGYELELWSDDALCPEGYARLRTMLLKNGEDDYQFIFNERIDVDPDGADQTEPEEDAADPEALWERLREERFAAYEPEEYRYGVDAVFSVVLSRGERAFADGGEEMPYEELVSYDGPGEDGQQFWWHEVYYDGEEVFATRTRGWYWVDAVTGAVSGAP